MKIWTANLYLGYDLDKKLSMRFVFEKEDREDYKVNGNYEEWIAFEDWVGYTIPMRIKIEEKYGQLKVIQGFDREMWEEEKQKIKERMIDCAIMYLENKQDKMHKEYDEKLIFLKNNNMG